MQQGKSEAMAGACAAALQQHASVKMARQAQPARSK